MKWLETIIDFVLPKKEDAQLAESVSKETLEALFHPRLAKEVWITSFFPYANHHIRALIRGIKFYGVVTPLPVVGTMIGEYLVEIIADKKSLSGWVTPIVIPIPSSSERLRNRGYNQAERFARHIYEEIKEWAELDTHSLTRTERKSQTHIAKSERERNVAGAFTVLDPRAILGRHIILIDDVVLSGGTLKDARRALLSAGAADVLAIAIAH